MQSLAQSATDQGLEIDKDKFSILHIYKVTTILFQWSFISALLTFLLYLAFIVPKGDVKMIVHLNHIVPLAVLVVDFYINCVPFVLRHYFVFALSTLGWLIYKVLTKDTDANSYFSWSEDEVGLLIPVIVLPLGWILHIILIWVNKQKMRLNNKTEALEQLNEIYLDLKY
jgi:hypothetical protein